MFGYREYPSLIKGGHASYQFDIDSEMVRSSETQVNIMIGLNHHVFEHNIPEVKPGGVLIHSSPAWKFTPEQQKMIKERKISIIFMPIDEILAKMNAKPILGNVVLTAFVWAMLEQDKEMLKEMVGERFAHKKDVLALNMQCIDRGYDYEDKTHGKIRIKLPEAKKKWKN